jgi:hypothetical protein
MPLSKFTYPVEKRRSAQNVEILRKAEANLDRFWLKVDRELLDKNGIPQRERLVQILPHGELQRTPKWTEPEKVTHAVGSFLLYPLHFQSLPVLALAVWVGILCHIHLLKSAVLMLPVIDC